MVIDATKLEFKELNEKIRDTAEDVEITGCLGQRFIAAGLGRKKIKISGVPGNALGAYLNGAKIMVSGNAQDAVGDTMNDGDIFIHGNIGDAACCISVSPEPEYFIYSEYPEILSKAPVKTSDLTFSSGLKYPSPSPA